MTAPVPSYSFLVTLRFFREQSPTLSWAFCFLQFIEPRHLPGLFRFRLHHTHRSELGVLLELIYSLPEREEPEMSSMPDKPDTWVIVLAWLSQHSPTIYAAVASAVMAALRIIYGGGTRRQALLEATICMLLTTSLIAVLEYFGLPSSLATPAGIWVGFLGVKKIADIADRVADFKLPKRNADQ